MIEDILELPKNGTAYKTGYRFYKSKICDYSKRHVYCCTGDKHPSEEQVKKLKAIEPCGGFGNITKPEHDFRLNNYEEGGFLDIQIQCSLFSDENKFPELFLRFR